MPTYEYSCAKCGASFETVQSIKDGALRICPKEACPRKPWGKGKVKRAVGGGSGLLFKGSGFYITDYRSDNYKAGAKKDASASSSSDTKSTKTESKPATPAAPSTTPASTPKKD